jgi:hypothetical protein
MTNYQCEHIQIFCDVMKNTSSQSPNIGLQILTIVPKKNFQMFGHN